MNGNGRVSEERIPTAPEFDQATLLERLQALGDDARDSTGAISRLAFSDSDRSGRDLIVGWFRDARPDVAVDARHGRARTTLSRSGR